MYAYQGSGQTFAFGTQTATEPGKPARSVWAPGGAFNGTDAILAWEDLRSGALETAMDDWRVEPIALHLVTPPGRSRPARVQALMDYLSGRFTAAPWARSAGERAARRQ